ncbi:MAG: hypothetical protein K6A98_08495, partial [Prevotella sp.]|nr:hypothetical protein [Prevotella sp.]
MKKLITLFSLVLMTISVSAQSVRGDLNGDGQVTTTDVTELYNIIFGTAAAPERNMNYNVNGVTFKMVKVDGGTFQMGATSDQGNDASVRESPVHSVTLSDYWIGET